MPARTRHLIGLALGSAILAGCTPTPPPSSAGASIAPAPAPSPSPSPTPTVTATPVTAVPSQVGPLVTCVPFTGPLRPGLDGDPCPSALKAIGATVGSLGFPVSRIFIEPGPFLCGVDLWPGVTSPPVCFGPFTEPGAWMHGWVAFLGTDKVAAVELSRLEPASASRVPPWRSVLKAFAVPPSGWAMP
jgi:hypothetical protein